MLSKGLCLSCKNDKSCIFARKFPVLECEEFSNEEAEKAAHKKQRILAKA
ncbi:MAG: hypothetical protein NTW13_04760 [Candidatus Omnitrophica bacterium]|nr:hypothetical protein [Candidatus Omnitrophota bacterium]